MRRSAFLKSHSKMDIKEVAGVLGYLDQSYFSRALQIHGVHPAGVPRGFRRPDRDVGRKGMNTTAAGLRHAARDGCLSLAG